MTHYNLVHKFIPMPQAMKIPDAKAAVDKEWKKLETIPAWNLGKKCQEQKGGYSGNTKRQQESPLCHIGGHMSPQECGVGAKSADVKWQSRALGDIEKNDSGAYAVFSAQGSSASQMTGAKIMDVIARLPAWVKLEDAARLLKIPKIGMSRCLDTPSTTEMAQNHGKNEKLARSPYTWVTKGKARRKYRIGNAFSFIGNKGYFCQKMWMISKWLVKSRIWLPCGKRWMKNVDIDEPTSFLAHITWDALNVNANRMKQSLNNTKPCLKHVFLLKQQKN